MTQTSDFITLVKPRITSLVIFTTFSGLWLASHGHLPPMDLASWTLIGSVLLVGSANTLNMYIERDSDAKMHRTHDRPLPAQRMEPRVALVFGVVLCAVSLIILFAKVNLLTTILGLVAFVSYVLFYTPLKQRSHVALLVGAIPGAIPPLMGWTAVRDSIDMPGMILFFILFLWQIPHFLAIALFQKEEYAKAGIHVLPLVRGDLETKHCMIRYLVGLVAVTLYPVILHMTGQVYFWTALGGGLFFLGWGLWGLRTGTGLKWAKGLFFISIVYLPVILGVLSLTAKV